MTPRISVALCTYNGEKYIAEQIKSILKQTVVPDEIIIGDDGSQDRTCEIIDACLSASQIDYKIIVNEKNIGVKKNFWKTISLCMGDIIFTCDQDDVWRKDKVERMIDAFDEDTLLVFSNAEVVDDKLRPMGYSLWESMYTNPAYNNKRMFEILLPYNVVTGAAMAFRKELYNRCGEIIEKYFYHDGWLAINAAASSEKCIKRLNEKLIYYRMHGNNVCGCVKKNGINIVLGRLKNLQSWNKQAILNREKLSWYLTLRKTMHCFSEENARLLDKYIRFYKGKCSLHRFSRKRRLMWILRNLYRGNYFKYSTGIPSALKDVLFSKRKVEQKFWRMY